MAISRQLLRPAEISARLEQHPLWELRENCLFRKFQFKNFTQAWSFMLLVAEAAEKLDHHPDWRNVYNSVEIKLTTHDAGGITALDFALIEAIDDIGQ